VRLVTAIRNYNTNEPLWTQIPGAYFTNFLECCDGGISSGTWKKYTSGMVDYWKTMRKLNIPDVTALFFPTHDTLLQIYLIDCAKIREKKNCWDTCRGKLRAIDFWAQLAGITQDWTKNSSLFTTKHYLSRKHPGKGSDTLPVTADVLRNVLGATLRECVYTDITSGQRKDTATRWKYSPKVVNTEAARRWYVWTMGMLCQTIIGLRGAECFEYEDKKHYLGYGIQLRDVTAIWASASTQKLTEKPSGKAKDWKLHHLRIELRHTKCGRTNNNALLRIGRTYRSLDPAVLIYELKELQRSGWHGLHSPKGPLDYLFTLTPRDLHLGKAKKRWKKRVAAVIQIQPERYRFHGTRKGFATQLQQNGVDISLIAFAGRWTLAAAIYRYLIHSQAALLPIARWYLYGKQKNKSVCDPNRLEADMVRSMAKGGAPINMSTLETAHHLFKDPWKK